MKFDKMEKNKAFVSISANREPMQFLGPTPNGKYENGLMLSRFSCENLSGMNFSGSGKYFSSW